MAALKLDHRLLPPALHTNEMYTSVLTTTHDIDRIIQKAYNEREQIITHETNHIKIIQRKRIEEAEGKSGWEEAWIYAWCTGKTKVTKKIITPSIIHSKGIGHELTHTRRVCYISEANKS